MRLICLGFGYTAKCFVRRHGGLFDHIAATARDPASAQAVRDAGLDCIDLQNDDKALDRAIFPSDVILVSAGPTPNGDPFAARTRLASGDNLSSKSILYLSTVGVYGDHGGGWVDEATPPRPSSDRSRARLAAEIEWLDMGQDSGARIQVFRLAGIYGPGRSAVDNIRAGAARSIIKLGHVFNRIHVEDIADILAAALKLGHAGAIWNVADNEPAPPQDVIAYAARLLGVPAPPKIRFDDAALSPMARSFYNENKRISNNAIRERLGVALRFPTYREGMSALAAPRP